MGSSSSNSSGGGGIGFVGLLQIAFIVLKLTGYISWSWWWVLSPMWISAAIVAVVGVICVAAITFAHRSATKSRR